MTSFGRAVFCPRLRWIAPEQNEWHGHLPSMPLDPPSGYTSDIPPERAVITKVQKWGNSQGLRLGKALLAHAAIEVGDEVDVTVRDGAIVITPVRRVRGGHDLRDLVRRLPKSGRSGELEWGPPAGREVW